MYESTTSNQIGVPDGSRRDTRRPAVSHDPRSTLARTMLRLAKLRNADQTPTSDVQAAFKEGERSPLREPSL